MNRNNHPFAVLPVSSWTAKAAGAAPETLLAGQFGIFDAETNLSVVAATSPLPKNIYFAVGVDKNGDGTTDDFRFSAGQFIRQDELLGYRENIYNAGTPMTTVIGGYKAQCDTDYGIRVEFRNSRISRIQGFNQFSKAYIVTSQCCDDCAEGCGSLDANFLTKQFVDTITADEAGLLIAQAVARQAVTILVHGTSVDYAQGAVMTTADVDALILFNKTAAAGTEVYTDIKLTSVPLAIGSFNQINLSYHKLLETTLIVSLIEGFNCSGATTTSVYPVFAEGTGTNVMQKEYHASAWNGAGPYKLSEVTGMAKGNIEYLANKATNYDQVSVEYNFGSESGWQEYKGALGTIVAFPTGTCASRTALTAFLAAWSL